MDCIPNPLVYYKIARDYEGNPVDIIFLTINSAFEKMIGLSSDDIINKRAVEVFPEINKFHFDRIGNVDPSALIGESKRIQHYFETLERWYEVTAVSNRQGYFAAVFRNITEQKQVEDELKKSEERFRTAIKNSSIIVAQINRELRYTWIYNLNLDFNPDIFIGKRDDELALNHGTKKLMQVKKQVIETGVGIETEIEFPLSDNNLIYNITVEPLRDSTNQIIGATTAAFDITEQKKTEAILKESQKRFRDLVENTSDLIWEIDKEGFYTYVSPNVKQLLGYEPKEFIDKNIFNYMDNKEASRVKKFHEEAITRQEPVNLLENTMTHKEGYPVIFETNAVPVFSQEGLVQGIRGVDRNITDRKRVEDALRESEERFRLAASSTSDLVYEWNLSDNSLRWFGDIDKLMRYEKGQFPCTIEGWKAHIHPEDKEKVLATTAEGMKKKKHWANTYRVIRKDGRVIHLHGTGIGVYKENDKIVTVIGAISDITQRKQAEEVIRENEKYYRQMIELLPTAIFVYSDEKIIYVNNSAVNLVNAENLNALIGKSFTDFLVPENKDIFIQAVNEFNKNRNNNEKFMVKILSITGDVIDAEIVLTPFIYRNKEVVQIATYDLARQKKLEQEILKADKLESISLLAGGIAHDFNNILAAIMGNISLSLKDIKKEDKTFKRLKNAEKAIQQAKELTRQIQTFAKGGKPIKTAVSIEELTQEVIPFVLSGSNVQCNFTFPHGLSYVDIDAGQISQVLNNLVINAIHAMPDGGKLQVSAKNVFLGKGENDCVCSIEEGPYVRLMIQDSGMGIEKRNLKKIFDPFFTTKTEGSGLGLAASYSILKRHGGCITVESEPGEGASFYIYLPVSSEKKLQIIRGNRKIVPGNGRILVMDDEEAIRDVLGEMLVFLGYEVDFAKEGAEAIEKYKQSMALNKLYDIVILDLTIPGGMGGKQTISILKNINSEIKAIVSTGYSEDLAVSNCMDYGFTCFILKPYDIEQLSQVLSRI